MELKEFIKGVITDITNAVSEAQDELQEKATILPFTKSGMSPTKEGNLGVTEVVFDIAVSSESEETTKGGIHSGIKVASLLSIGGEAHEGVSAKNQNISRIQFSIPIVLPHAGIPEELIPYMTDKGRVTISRRQYQNKEDL